MLQIVATLGLLLIMSSVVLLVISVIAAVGAVAGGSFKSIFRKCLWGLLLPVAMLLYGIFIGGNLYKVNEVQVVSDKLPEAFDGYRIVQLSDLHAASFAHRNKSLRRAVEKVNSLDADLAVFTGDIVTFTSGELTVPIKEALRGIRAKDGVLATMGNHDYGFYALPSDEDERLTDEAAVRQGIRGLGWRLMQDENLMLKRGNDSISVIGVENVSVSRPFASFGNLHKAMEGAEAPFKILLSHDPSHWRLEVLGKTDIDLTLSGHTHAMQFSLFGWSPSRYLFREYRGLYSEAAARGLQWLYVNIGLGETGYLARIGARPEIALITLRKSVSGRD